MAALRIPLATYRVQFHRRFRFKDARVLAAYLRQLGVTDLYTSPILQARRGSQHGYDVTDPSRINPELGGEAEFDALSRELKAHGMGMLVDIVPNHMAASSENPLWMDVLENGAGSPYASFFDIDWHPAERTLEGKVLLPILGGPYGTVLENQELKLVQQEQGFFVRYYETRLPVACRTYGRILGHRAEELEKDLGADHSACEELRSLRVKFEHLPALSDSPALPAESARLEREVLKRKLWRLCQDSAPIREFLDQNVKIFNGRKGAPDSFHLLDQLLAEQAYWVAFWRLASGEINYRRFFAISDLVAVRVEETGVFEKRHVALLQLVREGKITGARVDHIDGLYDPRGFLERLQTRLAAAAGGGEGASSSFYVVVEKILEGEETLPPDWPVAGTTGYDFLNTVNGIFADPAGLRALSDVYTRFARAEESLPGVAYRRKKRAMEILFPGEMRALGQYLGRQAWEDRYARDLPREELVRALAEVTACLPVYRTYVRGLEVSRNDRRILTQTLAEARRRDPSISDPVYQFLGRVLTMELPGYLTPEQREARLEFVMRWQQFAGPIMAKGFEDTALYVYNRLVSLNEVGSDSHASGIPPAVFHRRLRARQRHSPSTMNASSTHDTKRSEDVRARIHVLSEVPEEWEQCLVQWSRFNEPKKRFAGGRPAPDRNEEMLLYQTMIGAWPLEPAEVPSFGERLRAYMLKAARESKVNTGWIRPNLRYESALEHFVEAVLEEGPENEFLAGFLQFQERMASYGAWNSLSQLLMKIAAPGVPDIYQGTELWDLSLVDPDNRRPVDFKKRIRMLQEMHKKEAEDRLALAQELVSGWRDGRIKLFLTSAGLRFRSAHADLFLRGEYLPLSAAGDKKENIVAFARRWRGAWIIAAIPRLTTKLAASGEAPLGEKAWGATTLLLPSEAPLQWQNVLTGETLASVAGVPKQVPAADLFRDFPVALLVRAG